MNIVHITSEVYPFSKTGGLADVLYSLPVAQRKMGNKVYVISPLYKNILKNFEDIKFSGRKTWVDTELGIYEFGIFTTVKEGVTFIFLSNLFLFERGGYYGKDGADYEDNFLIFGAFSKAALNLVKYFIGKTDIIHCHDWQAALVPAVGKTEFYDINAKYFFTIHNLAFQGIFDFDNVLKLKIDPWLCGLECLEFYGRANFLKAGIAMADFVTTVSPTYAKEVLRPEYGFGLDGFLNKHKGKFAGILNGLDYNVWNPATDKFIFDNYDEKNISGKFTNKAKLCNLYNLDERLPLFGFVSRFTEQKGIYLIIDALNETYFGANFIFLGDGDIFARSRLKLIENKPNIRIVYGYNETLSRKIYASSDFYLMPSRFEPCGISQLIAMRYGAVPVVRSTGGLVDTVVDVGSDNGHGIVFDNYTVSDLKNAINRAVNMYIEKKLEPLILKNMKKNYSWVKSAQEYVKLYEKVLNI
ncbi:MAG: glycogen synthase [Deferribacteraceae bacterium]|jgi:starch synthase|nr:glycogen synthase [Deferribacteraceae bacterium]